MEADVKVTACCGSLVTTTYGALLTPYCAKCGRPCAIVTATGRKEQTDA